MATRIFSKCKWCQSMLVGEELTFQVKILELHGVDTTTFWILLPNLWLVTQPPELLSKLRSDIPFSQSNWTHYTSIHLKNVRKPRSAVGRRKWCETKLLWYLSQFRKCEKIKRHWGHFKTTHSFNISASSVSIGGGCYGIFKGHRPSL